MKSIRLIGVSRGCPTAATLLVGLTCILGLIATQGASGQEENTEIPQGKKTSLELYVTAKEAYAKWKAEPEKVKIFDVRTTEEYLFVGPAEMAWNIPFVLQTYQWDVDK